MRHSTQCGTFDGLLLVDATSRVWAAARDITLPRFCKRQLVPRPGLASLSDGPPCDLTSGRRTPGHHLVSAAQPACRHTHIHTHPHSHTQQAADQTRPDQTIAHSLVGQR